MVVKRGSSGVKKTVGVYWGRFNPPHKGHIALAQRLAMKVDSLMIAVGSAESKDTKRNPFSGEERVEMWRAYLKEEHLTVKDVVAVNDGRSWASSIDNLFDRCGRFDILFTNHKTIARLVGDRAKVVGFRRKSRVSSTLIRDSIASGRSWEYHTGKSVVGLVNKFDGIKRIRRAYGVAE